MLVSTLYPSPWLNAADLNNKSATVEIARVNVEEIGSSRQEKPVMQFMHHDKRLILNKTNVKAIAELFGGDTDQWMGKKITLYPTVAMTADGEKPAIRVKAPADYVRPTPAETGDDPGWKPDPAAGDMDDEIPF